MLSLSKHLMDNYTEIHKVAQSYTEALDMSAADFPSLQEERCGNQERLVMCHID